MKSDIAENHCTEHDSALGALRQEANDLKWEADLLLAKREGVLRSIEIVEAKTRDVRPDSAITKTAKSGDSHSPLSGLTVDFDGTTGHRERVLRVAQAAGVGAVLNTSEVTRFLVDSVCSDFTVENLRPTIHRVFDEQPEVYEKVSPGNWTLVQLSEDVEHDSER